MKRLFAAFLLASAVQSYAQLPHWKSLPIRPNHLQVLMGVDTSEQALYLFGMFDSVNGVKANLVKWDGNNVTYLNVPHATNIGGGIIRYQGQLHVSGNSGTYRFDGSNWHQIDNSDRIVSCMYVYGDKLMAPGGLYDKTTKQWTNSIGLWDGNSWTEVYRVDTLFAGQLGGMTQMVEYKGELYFAGSITIAGKPAFRNIVRFDGKHWKDVGGGIPSNGFGWAIRMLVWKDDLYVCGQFAESDGAPGNCIARWDGQSWHRLAGGVQNDGYDAQVWDMAVHNDMLYIAGIFTSADGIPANGIARWDGTKWCTLGDIMDRVPGYIEGYNGGLYFSSGVSAINGDTSFHYLAQWTGGDYTEDCSAGLSVAQPTASGGSFIYPNPADNRIFIRSSDVKSFIILDVMGRHMISATYDPSTGIDVSSLAPGIYTLQQLGRSSVMCRFVRN